MNFSSIEDVRKRIDEIDSKLVKIIAQRSECVKVHKQATEAGLPEVIIEKIYRTMIGAFIDYELEQHDQLRKKKSELD